MHSDIYNGNISQQIMGFLRKEKFNQGKTICYYKNIKINEIDLIRGASRFLSTAHFITDANLMIAHAIKLQRIKTKVVNIGKDPAIFYHTKS
jgi:hypothetical protein